MTKPDHNTSLKEQLANLRAAKKEYSTMEILEHGQEVVDPEAFLLSLVESDDNRSFVCSDDDSDNEHGIKFNKNMDTQNLRTKRIIFIGFTSIVLSVLLFALL